MTRPLTIRQPTMAERFQLQSVMEYTDAPQLHRRAEALLLYAEGLNAVEIAQALQVHVNTIYTDLHAFKHEGLRCLKPFARGGAPARITHKQQEVIWRLAEREPLEFGLPYGRWSLANFREFLIKTNHVLKRISREHLRELLKKNRFVFSVFSANSLVMTRNAERFYPVFAESFCICLRTASCSSLMSSRWSSSTMAVGATAPRSGWSWSVVKRRAVGSISLRSMM